VLSVNSIRARFSLLVKLALFAALLFAAHQAGRWILGELDIFVRPSTEPMLHRLIMTATVIYIVVLALPFVPGVEIGLAMIMLFGPKIVPLVYLSTIVALLLAFLMGRVFPKQTIAEIVELLRLKRVSTLLASLEPLHRRERLEFLLSRTSSRWLPFLLKHRYIAVAVVLNTPGNAVIGGGGGISFLAGFSRLFSFPAYVLTVSLAVSPVPFLILLTGE